MRWCVQLDEAPHYAVKHGVLCHGLGKGMNRTSGTAAVLLTALFFTGCAHQQVEAPHDPAEPFNRKMHDFNMGLDRYVLGPVSRGYVKVTPDPVRRSVTNFFTNLDTPRVAVNNMLQGKPQEGGQDVARFLFNSTLGILGLFDVATDVGIPKHDEDFGQTLGVWGVGEGAYLVLPVFGPSSLRDGVGRVVDMPLDPVFYLDSGPAFVLTAIDVINLRANLDAAVRQLEQAFDPYAFLRASYLQRRQQLVRDGRPDPNAETFDDFDDDFDEAL